MWCERWVANRAGKAERLSIAYVHDKAIGIRAAGFRIPAPLSRKLEDGAMLKVVINLGAGSAFYVVGAR